MTSDQKKKQAQADKLIEQFTLPHHRSEASKKVFSNAPVQKAMYEKMRQFAEAETIIIDGVVTETNLVHERRKEKNI
jgi:hypothetical protein